MMDHTTGMQAAAEIKPGNRTVRENLVFPGEQGVLRGGTKVVGK
jgi:hypothetical protein